MLAQDATKRANTFWSNVKGARPRGVSPRKPTKGLRRLAERESSPKPVLNLPNTVITTHSKLTNVPHLPFLAYNRPAVIALTRDSFENWGPIMSFSEELIRVPHLESVLAAVQTRTTPTLQRWLQLPVGLFAQIQGLLDHVITLAIRKRSRASVEGETDSLFNDVDHLIKSSPLGNAWVDLLRMDPQISLSNVLFFSQIIEAHLVHKLERSYKGGISLLLSSSNNNLFERLAKESEVELVSGILALGILELGGHYRLAQFLSQPNENTRSRFRTYSRRFRQILPRFLVEIPGKS